MRYWAKMRYCAEIRRYKEIRPDTKAATRKDGGAGERHP